MFSNIRQYYQVMMGHSKTLKMRFWMIQNAKKEDFGRFLDLVCRVDLILHFVLGINDFEHVAM